MSGKAKEVWGVILAAGQGTRLAVALPTGERKQFLSFFGKPLFWHSASVFSSAARLDGLVFVFPEEDMARGQQLLEKCMAEQELGLEYKVIAGGKERQDSVFFALQALPLKCEKVLVHDAARPFLTPVLIQRVLDGLETGYDGVIPGIALNDTIKEVRQDSNHNNLEVSTTPERSSLRAIQTPQGFKLKTLMAAHLKSRKEGWQVTDDASLLELCNIPVLLVEGDVANKKITTVEDLSLLCSQKDSNMTNIIPCTGFGYDVHRYGGKRPFVLGGVRVDTDITIEAHSDGDVLVHALMDAILGCLGEGDIGLLFPDTNPALDNVNSLMLLSEVLEMSRQKGLIIYHVDLTVVAQTPRIAPIRIEIVKKLARILQVQENQVNLKGTTEEHLGFTGEKKGIKSYAIVTGSKLL